MSASSNPRDSTDETVDSDPVAVPNLAETAAGANVDAGDLLAGRYALEAKIGQGGMGEVWIAQQTTPVRRKVAVKFIKKGMDSPNVLVRFEQERQALAVMDHPNIAKVFDAGVSGGMPFFVMELVSGAPLTKFCDDAKLSIEERLALFVPICQAVQHAHQKGIIHRDLKPANILVATVDGKPTPKVIDFGVVKAVSGKLVDDTLATQLGAVIGTLEYMAPEQAAHTTADIDTRADVYSLGVILYELLTGLRPFDTRRLQKAALDELIRIIREEQPPSLASRLSTDESLPSVAANRQTAPNRLLSKVKTELDWIVQRCLEKDRNRRYESANGLARDIGRFLANEPIEARPVSASYRFRKFVSRNRGAVFAASVVAISLVGGIAGTTWKAMEASRERDEKEQARIAEGKQRERAEQSRDRARAALDLVTDDVVGLLLGRNEKLGEKEKTFLKTALSLYEEFSSAGEEEGGEAGRAGALLRVGAIRETLGDSQGAEDAFLQAEKLYAPIAAAGDPAAVEGLGTVLNGLGLHYRRIGKSDRAEPILRRAAANYAPSRLKPSGHPEREVQLATAHSNYGMFLQELGRIDDAEKVFKDALKALDRSTDQKAVKTRELLGEIHHNLGVTYRQSGRPEFAEKASASAIEARRSLAVDAPAEPNYRNDLALSLMNRGNLLSALRRLEPAEACYREGILLFRKLASEYPGLVEYRSNMALTHLNLAGFLRRQNRLKEAEPEYREALVLQKQLAEWHPEVHGYQLNAARTHNGLGTVLRALGRSAEAEEQLRAAIAIERKLVKDDARNLAARNDLCTALNNLGSLHTQLGRTGEAEACFREAIAERTKIAAAQPKAANNRRDLAGNWLALAALLESDSKRSAEEESALESALAIASKLAAEVPNDPETRLAHADSLERMGASLFKRKKLVDAESKLRECVAVRSKPPTDWRMFQTQSMLGGVLAARQAFAEAGPLLSGGYEGLKRNAAAIPIEYKPKLLDAVERLIEHAKATKNQADVQKWERERQDVRKAAATPAAGKSP